LNSAQNLKSKILPRKSGERITAVAAQSSEVDLPCKSLSMFRTYNRDFFSGLDPPRVFFLRFNAAGKENEKRIANGGRILYS
jgi:hypothetical protein